MEEKENYRRKHQGEPSAEASARPQLQASVQVPKPTTKLIPSSAERPVVQRRKGLTVAQEKEKEEQRNAEASARRTSFSSASLRSVPSESIEMPTSKKRKIQGLSPTTSDLVESDESDIVDDPHPEDEDVSEDEPISEVSEDEREAAKDEREAAKNEREEVEEDENPDFEPIQRVDIEQVKRNNGKIKWFRCKHEKCGGPDLLTAVQMQQHISVEHNSVF